MQSELCQAPLPPAQSHPRLDACCMTGVQEVVEAPGPHLTEIDEHTPNSKVYRNYAGQVCMQGTRGARLHVMPGMSVSWVRSAVLCVVWVMVMYTGHPNGAIPSHMGMLDRTAPCLLHRW